MSDTGIVAVRSVFLPYDSLVRRIRGLDLAPGATLGLVRDPACPAWSEGPEHLTWHAADGGFEPPVEASGLVLLVVNPASALPAGAELWAEMVETDATLERARRAARRRREEAEADALDAAIWRSGVPS